MGILGVATARTRLCRTCFMRCILCQYVRLFSASCRSLKKAATSLAYRHCGEGRGTTRLPRIPLSTLAGSHTLLIVYTDDPEPCNACMCLAAIQNREWCPASAKHNVTRTLALIDGSPATW